LSAAGPQALLLGSVAAVGVLHTLVPDHWLPIALLARQQGWSRAETGWAAARAGLGHVVSTLLIGFAVWLGGAALAERFGASIDIVSSAALVAFGGWIALSAMRELPQRGALPHHHGAAARGAFGPRFAAAGAAAAARHIHLHRHGAGVPHLHWHDHAAATAHAVWRGLEDDPPWHEHAHRNHRSTALLLIVGSSPMVEGIPAFFAAGKYGGGLIAGMAAAFALTTIATYVALCVASAASLQRLRLGPVERYGELLSGALIAAVGVAFGLLSLA
jgi:hypothetical protein